MSIQEHTRFYKRQNREITKFFAWVYNPNTGRNERGPLRLKRAEAVKDEAKILKLIEKGETFENKRREKKSDTGSKEGIFSTPASGRNMTCEDAYRLWIVPAKDRYAHATYKVYRYNYSHYIRNVFGTIPVREIKTEHVQKYINLLRAPKPEGKGYSQETVNKIINVLCNIFNFCKDTLKIIKESPMDGIKRLKVIPPDKQTWADEQQAVFLSSDIVRKSHIYPMLCISILGIRPGEVCGLAEADFHPADGLLTMHRGYDKYNVLTEMKNPQSHRLISLYPPITASIIRHLEWKKAFRRLDPDFADNDFLFVSINGRPINPDVYGKAFKKILAKYNKEADEPLPVISVYDLRHSFATINLLGLKKPINAVASVMGNSPKTLMTRYAHVLQRDRDDVTDDYSAKIFRAKAE